MLPVHPPLDSITYQKQLLLKRPLPEIPLKPAKPQGTSGKTQDCHWFYMENPLLPSKIFLKHLCFPIAYRNDFHYHASNSF